jgi:hypothetical protein
MITETELKEAFDSAVQDFLINEIKSKSLAYKIGNVKVFDKGANFVVEKEGQTPVEIKTKEIIAKAVLRNEYLIKADFEMRARAWNVTASLLIGKATQINNP